MEEMNNQEPQMQNTQQFADNPIEQIVKEATNIQNLVKQGTLNEHQGQYYMSQLAEKTFERLNQGSNIYKNAFTEFDKQKPDFFKQEGRSDVLEYLKKSDILVDKDEIDTISQMIEKLENCAIQKYLQQQAHDKALNDENESAKKKLTANAQNANSFGNKNMTFTREQIGKMSGAEFTKYEPLIMEQLKKGLIH